MPLLGVREKGLGYSAQLAMLVVHTVGDVDDSLNPVEVWSKEVPSQSGWFARLQKARSRFALEATGAHVWQRCFQIEHFVSGWLPLS